MSPRIFSGSPQKMTDPAKTLDLLESLKLKGMARVLEAELARADKDGIAPVDLINRLVHAEFHHRQERSLLYRINQAQMPWPWTLDTFPFHQQPGVGKSQIMGLASLSFVDRGENIVLIGESGNRKNRSGYRIVKGGPGIRASRPILQGSGSVGRTVCLTGGPEPLPSSSRSSSDTTSSSLTNWVYLTLNEQQVNAFFKLMDERYSRKSTIITSNLDYPQWYDLFQRKPLVDALLDRLKHRCITIRITGPSLRVPTNPESPEPDQETSLLQKTKSNRK